MKRPRYKPVTFTVTSRTCDLKTVTIAPMRFHESVTDGNARYDLAGSERWMVTVWIEPANDGASGGSSSTDVRGVRLCDRTLYVVGGVCMPSAVRDKLRAVSACHLWKAFVFHRCDIGATTMAGEAQP